MDTSLLGILTMALIAYWRDLKQRIADVILERDTARQEAAHWLKEYNFLRRGYDALAGMYQTVTRRMPNAEPLPFDPDALRIDEEPPS
jgi:hypothetical protein